MKVKRNNQESANVSSAYLFTQGAVATLSQPIKLKRFSQQGVEGFPCAEDSGGVGRDCESCHITHLL